MTKTLTEQWREGDMNGGIYYCKTKSYGEKKLWFHYRVYGGMYVQTYGTEEMFPEEDIIEVLAPVPSYDHFSQLVKKVECLQEQLSEANEIIANFRTYDFTRNDELAEEYQVKYGIAGEKIYMNRKPSKEFERWRKKITKSLEKKLKSGV